MPFRATLSALLLVAAAPVAALAVDPDDPRIVAAVDKAVQSLRTRVLGGSVGGGHDSLAGYALLKGGLPHDDEAVQRVLKRVEARFATGTYRPSKHHTYEAGCDLMFLEALDPEKYERAIAATLAYLAASRRPSGAWHYPGNSGYGDQSITQYGALGLWAAARTEVGVDPRLWDGLAAWEVGVQLPDGGFTYHPTAGGGGGSARNTMTSAGIANLLLSRRYLYGLEAEKPKPEKKEPKPLRFGVLEKVEAEEVAKGGPADEAEKPELGDYRPRTPEASIDRSLAAANAWFVPRFPPRADDVESHVYYYWYGVERMASLADAETINGVDWYDAGAAFLLRSQRPDGAFGSNVEHTCFGILFLQNTTRELLGKRKPRGQPVGAGLLAGGRGMPADLSKLVEVRDGEATVHSSTDPLDELLASLADPAAGGTVAAQEALVEKIRLGSRKELVEKLETILELLDHPNWEVRRTAVWALGRTESLDHAHLLVAALEDESLDVAVEARNALCFLSRKPLGLGAHEDPFHAVEEDAPDEKRTAAAKAWQKDVHERWSNWLEEKAPYDRRDRIDGVRSAAKS